MAFIVKKTIHGREYYYLNENKRIEGKVKTRTLAYLGKTKKQAEKKAREILKKQKPRKVKIKEEKTKMIKQDISIEDMATFCKRRGFVYPSGDIYGGFAGFWDFGHLGVEFKNNIKQSWWDFHVRQREDIVGIDGSIITNPKVWEASGHVGGFNVNDILVSCKKCKKQNKVEKFEIRKVKCENCGGEYDWDNAQIVEQMFKTNMGIDDFAYLRPETAQLIFTNFKYVYDNARMKLPFGIAQMGKAFRNEIAPRDFLFRTREFEQMEIEYFIKPGQKCSYGIGNTKILVYSAEMQESGKEPEKMTFKQAYKKAIMKTDWHAYWLEQEFLWFINLGANPEKFRVRQHMTDEKSHYALDTWDLEYEFPFGWKELEGMANRTDFDLKQHEKFSGKDLKIFDMKEKFLPHVVCEPSLGVGRAFLVFIFDAYYYDKVRDNIILKLHPKLAPIKAAVFPIVKRNDFEKIAEDIVGNLKQDMNVIYDKSGSIGRRYARNDEIGTPYCITIDEDSSKKEDVTIRDRDTKQQIRVKISKLNKTLKELLDGKIKFENAGKCIN